MASPISEIVSIYKDANLKYLWPFDGNSNSLTGSQNGTDSNITYQTSPAMFGQSAQINSNADRITLGTVFPVRLISGSVSAWVYLTGNGVDGGAVYLFSSWWTKGDIYARIGVWNDNKVRAYYYSTGFTTMYFDSNTVLDTGKWYSVAYTWNATGSTIYINGIADATSSNTFYNGNADGDSGVIYVGLGPEVGALNYVFSGNVDDLALFNRDLSAEEVKLIYDGNPSVSIFQPISLMI